MKDNQLDLADMPDDQLMKYLDGMGRYDTRGKELDFENMTDEEHQYWDKRLGETIKILQSARKILKRIEKQHMKAAKKDFDNLMQGKKDFQQAKLLVEWMTEKGYYKDGSHTELWNDAAYLQAVREAIKKYYAKKG